MNRPRLGRLVLDGLPLRGTPSAAVKQLIKNYRIRMTNLGRLLAHSGRPLAFGSVPGRDQT